MSGLRLLATGRVLAAHAAQTNRTLLSLDAEARFADLPDVLAVEP